MRFATLVLLAALAGCSSLGRSYLGVRPGTTRYDVSFVGSSAKLAIAGSAAVRQVGVRFEQDRFVEETETTSEVPRALAHEAQAAPVVAHASSEVAWAEADERDAIVQFALKRVFRMIDFRVEDAGDAQVTTKVTHAPTEADRKLACEVRFASRSGKDAQVTLVLEPGVGLVSATATTADGVFKLRRAGADSDAPR